MPPQKNAWIFSWRDQNSPYKKYVKLIIWGEHGDHEKTNFSCLRKDVLGRNRDPSQVQFYTQKTALCLIDIGTQRLFHVVVVWNLYIVGF